MVAKNVMKILAVAILLGGVVLLVATGRIASALGAVEGGTRTGATDPAGIAYWFQLSFVRLFATALLGLSAIFFWGASHLSVTQQRSLAIVLACVMGSLALMAVSQQVAIWNSNAGWVLALLLAGTGMVCIGLALQPTLRRTA